MRPGDDRAPVSVAEIDIRATARTVSAVENRGAGHEDIVRAAYRAARDIPVVGVTGPPGAGKSTLLDWLAVHWAERGERVAVLAVDPSSPFTGGAVLGDRFRMDRAAAHPRVYLRSLASRGQIGGLGRTTTDIATVLGYLGFDRVLLETVGAGQTDVVVGAVADVVVVVAVPGLGDEIQASKAGILEIGDVYAVNKSDRPGAEAVVGDLQANLDLVYPGEPGRNASPAVVSHVRGNEEQRRRHGDATSEQSFWRPPVVPTRARDGDGVIALAAAVDDFIAWSRATGRHGARLQERLRNRVLRSVEERIVDLCLRAGARHGIALDGLVADVMHGRAGPDEAAERLIAAFLQPTPAPK